MPSDPISLTLRRRVQERAGGFCEYCRAPDSFATSPFHCEHIIPQSAGGESILDNLAWACPRCNNHKHAKTHARDPQTGRSVPLFNPRLKTMASPFYMERKLFIYYWTDTNRQSDN